MMLRAFLAALFLCLGGPVAAQAWDGPGQQPIVFPDAVGAPEQLGDGSNAHGGTPPAASRVADVPDNFDITAWMEPACKTVGATACSSYTSPAADNDEAKFRTHCTTAKVGWFDPILYPGQANAGHPHLFFGNTGVTKDSTYQSLRTTGDSTCGGGILNRSSYWIPCLMWGPNKCLKSDYQIVYYNVSPASSRGKYVPFPNGFAYVSGNNPADMADTYTKGLIDAQNARPGSAKYLYPDNGAGWKAIDGAGATVTQGANAPLPNQVVQPFFRKKDGSWSMTIPTGGKLLQVVNMPQCWDGKNLTSPDARRHVIQAVRQAENAGTTYCPIGWYRIPQFEMVAYYSVTQEEVASGNLYLSSDRMGTDQSKWTNEGATNHNDWLGAWSSAIMRAWEANCNGISDVPGFPSTMPAKAGIGTSYCDGRLGITGSTSPTGRSPQLDLSKNWSKAGAYRYFPVVKPIGPLTGAHTHGM